ncbi:uncharacterized protein LOC101901154 [Musca domestica]|uniref:Uncharacterized protein LOC101901154 n=1 Tax=Musca domestica TaxID=7370 RepID=A0A9J7I580_MUSDO|nr:uncharacterized protein LOC101901154 [Musca domestica]XP_011294330.2 uncharacterized protein LOC101901154 [Musca domestica]
MGSETSKSAIVNNEDTEATISFKINGIPYSVNLVQFPADITLNTFIRDQAQLTATKFMCLEGGCGACVVAIRGRHPVTGELKTWAVNSCLTLLNTCNGLEVLTCEGIGNKRDGYHPIQKRLAQLNGTQCGFCTPGFVMNMYSLLESKSGEPTMDEIENSFGGNICRCTGYRPILDAMKSFACDSTISLSEECQDIEDIVTKQCPKSNQTCNGQCANASKTQLSLSYYDGCQWYWPKKLEELIDILSKIDSAVEYMLVAGNTAHGVYRRSQSLQHFIAINEIADLKKWQMTNDIVTLGANISLSEAMEIFKEVSKQTGFEYCQQLWEHFDLIANVPVRNSGTLAGNIAIKRMHHEFPSDIFITFNALNAQVKVTGPDGKVETMSLYNYVYVHKTPKTFVTSFELPAYPTERFIFKSYKIMPRAQNAHAYVNAAFLLELEPKTSQVINSRICFGGISPNFVHASAVEGILRGQCFHDKRVVEQIFSEMQTSVQPNENLTEASPDYRRKLACGLMLKFLLEAGPEDKVKPEFRSGGPLLKRELSSGIQIFATNEKFYPVTKAVKKIEGLIQCSGEATYMNDILTSKSTVYCAFVGATKVGCSIERIDASDALKVPGVIAFYSAKDIPGINSFVDPAFRYESEEIFCSDVVKYYDQPLGMVVALSSDIANHSSTKVKVLYSKSTNAIMPTLHDVLSNNRLERIHCLRPSPLKEIRLTATADITTRGIFEMGLQYHFTMEPHTCVAVPFERGLQVWSATHWMDHTQAAIAKMLGITAAEVQLKVRRLGGTFGCKITRGNAVACAASLAAFKLNRPARFVQTIESMMNCNGKRWGCRSDYEFHIKADGKIVGLRNTFYEDAGCTLNENPITLFASPPARNCYAFTADNYKLEGNAVLTDAASSAWCRAPASLEGIAMIENILDHIAFEANIDPADARMINIAEGNKMRELLPKFLSSTEYRQRRKEIDDFNSGSRWLKRGIGMAIMDFPLEYTGQYSATVSIYHIDGSVVISHGGIEMGQGLNTKVAQVAAYVLGVSMDLIKIESSDTINGANSAVTASSVGSESLCFAVRSACNKLNDRLKPVKDSFKSDATWLEVVGAAWSRSINLIVSDHYKSGDMTNYHIYGLALTEVQVDILTGNNVVKRVDILEDTGESLSPYVDIGQIEGAFVMGLGYWLTEQLIYNRQTGQLLTNRSWNYKPPGAKDIPIDFRVEMLKGSANTGGFMRSKATGEPPSCLAVSVIFALQHALQSARKDAGLKKEWLRLGAPTTPEQIVLSAGHEVSSFSLE